MRLVSSVHPPHTLLLTLRRDLSVERYAGADIIYNRKKKIKKGPRWEFRGKIFLLLTLLRIEKASRPFQKGPIHQAHDTAVHTSDAIAAHPP